MYAAKDGFHSTEKSMEVIIKIQVFVNSPIFNSVSFKDEVNFGKSG
jgi:hypothetical protein